MHCLRIFQVARLVQRFDVLAFQVVVTPLMNNPLGFLKHFEIGEGACDADYARDGEDDQVRQSRMVTSYRCLHGRTYRERSERCTAGAAMMVVAYVKAIRATESMDVVRMFRFKRVKRVRVRYLVVNLSKKNVITLEGVVS